jgi:hypothetical protein
MGFMHHVRGQLCSGRELDCAGILSKGVFHAYLRLIGAQERCGNLVGQNDILQSATGSIVVVNDTSGKPVCIVLQAKILAATH